MTKAYIDIGQEKWNVCFLLYQKNLFWLYQLIGKTWKACAGTLLAFKKALLFKTVKWSIIRSSFHTKACHSRKRDENFVFIKYFFQTNNAILFTAIWWGKYPFIIWRDSNSQSFIYEFPPLTTWPEFKVPFTWINQPNSSKQN